MHADGLNRACRERFADRLRPDAAVPGILRLPPCAFPPVAGSYRRDSVTAPILKRHRNLTIAGRTV